MASITAAVVSPATYVHMELVEVPLSETPKHVVVFYGNDSRDINFMSIQRKMCDLLNESQGPDGRREKMEIIIAGSNKFSCTLFATLYRVLQYFRIADVQTWPSMPQDYTPSSSSSSSSSASSSTTLSKKLLMGHPVESVTVERLQHLGAAVRERYAHDSLVGCEDAVTSSFSCAKEPVVYFYTRANVLVSMPLLAPYVKPDGTPDNATMNQKKRDYILEMDFPRVVIVCPRMKPDIIALFHEQLIKKQVSVECVLSGDCCQQSWTTNKVENWERRQIMKGRMAKPRKVTGEKYISNPYDEGADSD